uniref:Uncharacterized protein n=1 Tax=Tanacetum cinerariifolium TaxID=118510 RepID=A0A699UFA9_TANCI|nr:hypothetical protein [Tanacetum cinerariifolium]
MPPYMSWAPLRSGKHHNSKRGLADVVVTGWKQDDWVTHWIEEMPLKKIVQKQLLLWEIYSVKVHLDQLLLRKANRLNHHQREELLQQ